MITTAYDITCQWFVNLFRRMAEWESDLKVPSSISIIPVIPKFHHPAHKEEKHEKLDCNLVAGCGSMDCECCERVWGGSLNAAAHLIKSMGPGSCLVMLNDHIGFYNWLKYVGMGNTLCRRYTQAVKDRNQQVKAHCGLTASLPSGLAEKWEKMCVRWGTVGFDKAKVPNPYETEKRYMSQKAVERELAEAEADRLKWGGISYHPTSASAFVLLGLELEQSQRKLHKGRKQTNDMTDLQEKTATEHQNMLCTKLQAWSLIQPIYMPSLLCYLTEMNEEIPDGSNDDVEPEDIVLWLPSAIPASRQANVCTDGLINIESKLRYAQCFNSLDGVWHTLRLKTRMLLFKYANVSGQREGVKSQMVINSVHNRAKGFAETYHAARVAYLNLVGPGVWEEQLKVLKDGDVRSYVDPERVKQGPGQKGIKEDEVGKEIEDQPEEVVNDIDLVFKDRRDMRIRAQHGTGQTQLELSWIWLTSRINTANKNDEVLREVWCRSRARANHAKEQVLLVQEEMQRTLRYLEWKANEWKEKMTGGGWMVDTRLGEGLRSYALKQAHIQQMLAAHFCTLWSQPLQDNEDEDDIVDSGLPDNDDEGERADDEEEYSDEDELDEEQPVMQSTPASPVAENTERKARAKASEGVRITRAARGTKRPRKGNT
ncbi:hypothetical protein PM082_022722 [Marasmius tenuissimus]|nr:hypothetical protein PM082_022722 [Marasmius tenuissimus]